MDSDNHKVRRRSIDGQVADHEGQIGTVKRKGHKYFPAGSRRVPGPERRAAEEKTSGYRSKITKNNYVFKIFNFFECQ